MADQVSIKFDGNTLGEYFSIYFILLFSNGTVRTSRKKNIVNMFFNVKAKITMKK